MTGPPPPNGTGQTSEHADRPRLALGRAAVLIVVAVILGAYLLGVASRPPVHPGALAAATGVTTTTGAATSTTGGSTSSTSSPTTTAPPATTSTTARRQSTTKGSNKSKTSNKSTTTTTAAAKSSVSVLVANGTSTSGAAGAYTQELQSQGWNTLAPVNTTSSASKSAVYYAPGQEAAGSEIASSLKLASSSVQPLTSSAPVSSTSGVDVLLVVGPGLASSAPATTNGG